jgi:hypothetical protein
VLEAAAAATDLDLISFLKAILAEFVPGFFLVSFPLFL